MTEIQGLYAHNQKYRELRQRYIDALRAVGFAPFIIAAMESELDDDMRKRQMEAEQCCEEKGHVWPPAAGNCLRCNIERHQYD